MSDSSSEAIKEALSESERFDPHSSVSSPQAEELLSPELQQDGHLNDSPLRLISSEPKLHALVSYLAQKKDEILATPERQHVLHFAQADLRECRAAFGRTIRHGEEGLHKLCQLLGDHYFNHYQIQSVVIGEVETNRQRFTFIENISLEELFSTTDLDLGNRQLEHLRYFDGAAWSKAQLVANMVEYQPVEPNRLGIHKFISRIKAEEEIWNKVVDEIFHLDELVRRDKKLRLLSRYVKDIFGLKIVVGSPSEALRVQQELLTLSLSDGQIAALHLIPTTANKRLHFIEIKNYLSATDRKRSGWQALKSVVRWNGKTFEIQIQPLRNFLHERERLTRESHAGFKAQRERIRDEIAMRIPLFGFYRDLLKWLFLNATATPPTFPDVLVQVDDEPAPS